MEKIYVITKTQRITCGHGDSMDDQMLATMGAYGSDGYCPSFRVKEDAEKWVQEQGKRWCEITELEIR